MTQSITVWKPQNILIAISLLISFAYQMPFALQGTSMANTTHAAIHADFVVNDPSDPGNPDCLPANCSLRAAITAANLDGAAGNHTILFDLPYPATISLADPSPLPDILGTLTVNGPGIANLTIDAGGAYRIFSIASGAALTLSGVTLQNGYEITRGGGILNDHGTLSLSDSVLADSLAGGGDGGGLYNDSGTTVISNVSFLNNNAFHNGAVTNLGDMTITDSLFDGNRSRLGGAIDNSGSLTITNSTFSNNIGAPVRAGAIENTGSLVISNSTFTGNGGPIGADIDNAGGTVNVTNSTFTDAVIPSANSINTTSSGTTTLRNTLLSAGNGIPNCETSVGSTLTADPFNQATDTTCDNATAILSGQLRLGTLQNNGGSTPTIALLFSSTAVDAGDDTICAAAPGAPNYGAGATDQRGEIRPAGPHCDVGAYEQPANWIFLPVISN